MDSKKEGTKLEKYFSTKYSDVFSNSFYSKRDAKITDDTGNLIEKLDNVVFPPFWSYNASNTVATKYFYKEDVSETGRELDIRQLTKRVAYKIAEWGKIQNYFSEDSEAKNLEDEITVLTMLQYGSFNSPVWFNMGLDEYGLNKEGENFYVDEKGELKQVENSFTHPQNSACFIVSPEDSIKSMIYVGAKISSEVFHAGSGMGGDWSKVRSSGEPVSGGGRASGAVRFMDVQDACARVIKSGGKNRRAAVLQSIFVGHPDMPEILKHKYKEEIKARVLIKEGSPKNWESHTIQDLRAQNVNISIRTDDAFWEAYEKDEPYPIRKVLDGEVLKYESARKLARIIAFATHGCGDPGIQNHSIINKWNTCKESGEIWATNPCSEYNFLNNSACNLASLNLMKFRNEDGTFNLEEFYKAVDIYITAQDILVSQSSYPTKEIAWNSHIFRPLGLGYANLGAYILSLGLPYDSDEARNIAAAITSNMTAEAYLQSTKLAEKVGTFNEFEKNKNSMLEIIEMHREAAKKLSKVGGLEHLVDSSIKKWDEVIERGEKYGFRNAQVTLLAPTGTIGFMMDCDTTGCEPEYALKKYKELAGGGSMRIVNQTIPMTIKRLGYNSEEIEKVVAYIDKYGTVEKCEIIKEEHLPVFDCAVSSDYGERAIHQMGHIKMLGAIQQHLSGAASKTINCPEDTTVEEIEDMQYQAWKLGVKACAIYRDGAKVAQPLKTKKSESIQILKRGEREFLPSIRNGLIQKFKISSEAGPISVFLTSGEYKDGRLGEIFIESLERGSEINRLLNENAIQFSEKLQYGVPVVEAVEVFSQAGRSQQISGLIQGHPFIPVANCIEQFISYWIKAHYLGDISFVEKGTSLTQDPEMRPLPQELRVYQLTPELHLLPTVCGENFYPGAPSLEETVKKISGTNYWLDAEDNLDTRETIEKIKKTRIWKEDNGLAKSKNSSKLTGATCSICGNLMISDGSCFKCPSCKTSTGGCGGG